MRSVTLRITLALGLLLALGCGAKTGLLVPEIDEDASVDMSVLPDMPRVDGCMDVPFVLAPRPAEVMFTIDRSTSMALGLDGLPPDDPSRSRWRVLGDVLLEALRGEPLIDAGGKFFPEIVDPGPELGPEDVCQVSTMVEVEPGPGSENRVVRVFADTEPFGGTPTVDAVRVTADFLLERTRPEIPQFIVLATDGGPNCNPPPGPLGSCDCAGLPESCLDPTFGRVNCLDDERAIRVIGEIADSGIPIFLIGFDDPTRPDLAAILDDMAIAGGRPRPVGSSRRFYDVRDRSDLEGALGEITASVGRCLLVTDFRPDPALQVSVRVDGLPVPEDPMDGWQWRDRDAGEIELLGEACRRATENPDVIVDGVQTCFASE